MANQGFDGLDVIGDLGCSGVDVAAWLAANRAPLYPGKVNRWLLARTLRDNPSTTQVKETLHAVFIKWFEGVAIDVFMDTSTGGRTDSVDGIQVVNAARGERPTLKHPVARREGCQILVPTVEGSKGVLWVEAAFNYRGTKTDMPWPVWSAMAIGAVAARQCPVKADWMLVEASAPAGDAPPEQSNASIVTELITQPVADVTKTAVSTILEPLLSPVLLPVWIGLGIWAYSKAKGK